MSDTAAAIRPAVCPRPRRLTFTASAGPSITAAGAAALMDRRAADRLSLWT